MDELQCCSDVEVLVCKAVENVQVLEAEKKNRRGLTQTESVSKKIFKESNVEIEKSAWTGLDKSKKASSAASVFKILQDRSPGGRRCVLHFDGLPLTRGVVDAYTLRGCVFADIQSREEFTDALAS